ncbi:uncharacterized protein FA14DRAFT_192134 [Meira miltonrushii]|uniref:Zn(2)-C6 fungal-type domain-containing protein n=1 Tax=Meira miltonrushii TaxID=1280837 RepID=A0A316VAA4_9BASI|nr:uncharacterized protein FA14DRAFT_192134 [Meira miltonrushii]PWN33103.1 hypothetical protein FA14DRAFT_192134 [Meira miltonrushii]
MANQQSNAYPSTNGRGYYRSNDENTQFDSYRFDQQQQKQRTSSTNSSASTSQLPSSYSNGIMQASSSSATVPPSPPQLDDQKKRRRIQQACKACSFRRVKCNGENPCETCKKNEEECSYGQAKKRGPAKGTTRGSIKKHGMQRDNFEPSRNETAYSPQSDPSRHQPQYQQHFRATSYGGGSSSSFTSPPYLPSPQRSREYGEPSRSSFSFNAPRDTYGKEGSSTSNEYRAPPLEPYTRSHSYRDGMPGPSTDHYPRSDPIRAPFQQSSYHDPSLQRESKPLQSVEHPNATLAERLHKSIDIEGQELADLVLAQLYRERQDAKRKESQGSKSTGKRIEKGTDDHQAEASRGKISVSEQMELPTIPDAIIPKLFNVFWSVIMLHWPVFLRHDYPTVDDLRLMCENDHPFLFNSICSLAALVWASANEGGSLDSGSETTLSARQISTIFAVRAHYHHISAILNPTIESTAAMSFLSLRETGAGRPSQAAHYCWTACRMVMDLGLHRQTEMAQIMGSSFTKMEDEYRRRIYWSIYVIDKMMAVQLGRPPVLRDAESDCPLPSFEGEENVWTLPQKSFSEKTNGKPLNMATYFTHGCRLARLSEYIITQYNVIKGKQTVAFGSVPGKDQPDWQSTVAYLHQQLEEWDQQTPMNLRWYANKGEAFFPYIIHQQMWAQACRILLHRPYILKPTDKHSGINSHAECSKATDAIWQMFCDYERLFSLGKVPSSTVYCLFSAATIALANTTSIDSTLCKTAKRQLCDIVGWFIKMTETWSSATQHLAILEKLSSTINVDLSETGLQEPGLRAALQNKLEIGTMGMYGTERVRNTLRSKLHPNSVSDGKSGVSLLDGIPSLGRLRQPTPASHMNSPSANTSSFNTGNLAVNNQSQAESSTAEEQLQSQSLDAFWPDMPLGEDFQRWLSFTHTYFTVLGNSSNENLPIEQISNAPITMASSEAYLPFDSHNQQQHGMPSTQYAPHGPGPHHQPYQSSNPNYPPSHTQSTEGFYPNLPFPHS